MLKDETLYPFASRLDLLSAAIGTMALFQNRFLAAGHDFDRAMVDEKAGTVTFSNGRQYPVEPMAFFNPLYREWLWADCDELCPLKAKPTTLAQIRQEHQDDFFHIVGGKSLVVPRQSPYAMGYPALACTLARENVLFHVGPSVKENGTSGRLYYFIKDLDPAIFEAPLKSEEFQDTLTLLMFNPMLSVDYMALCVALLNTFAIPWYETSNGLMAQFSVVHPEDGDLLLHFTNAHPARLMGITYPEAGRLVPLAA